MIKVTRTIYKITEELLKEKEESEKKDFDGQYSNNCKYLVEVLNSVAIDELIFKNGNTYEFKEESKEFVKNLIEHHSVYKKLMKVHPDKRDALLLDELTINLRSLLTIEIEDEKELHRQLAIVEFMTHNKRIQFNNFVQSISVVSLSETLNPFDEIMLYSYYVKELSILQEKFEEVRKNMIEIRNEEVITASLRAIERNENVELYPEREELDRLVVKILLDSKKKNHELVRIFYNTITTRFSLSESEARNELKRFKEQDYKGHPYFVLRSDREEEEEGEYIPPYEALQKALEMYEEDLNEPLPPKITEESLQIIKSELKRLGKLDGLDDDYYE